MATGTGIVWCAAMIRPNDDGPLVYLCVEPVDGRKQINGLAQVVQDTLSLNPFSTHLFAFTNKRRDRCRILYWEQSGFVLWLKRLGVL
jgi:transposase